MKDFVRDVWKIGAVCATGAFLLSLVIGLIAGSPFGIVFFRALLFGLVFAGLGAGLRVVVKSYLPELIASNAQTAGKPGASQSAGYRGANQSAGYRGTGESDHRGAAVDIVLPEDEGLRRQAYSGSSPRAPQAGASDLEPDGEVEEATDAESMDEDSTSRAEAQALGELAEELAEELPGVPEGRSPGAKKGDDSMEEAESEDDLERAERESSGDLDSLPDIAAIELPSEQRSGPGSARSARLPTPGQRPQDAVRDVLSGQDPATLARALRTVLKKDEKG
ncbi:MAG: hypothetical protein ABSG21_07310 [Spirochaetia bacterium]